tara:strand:+ start:2333 stop:4399 length:2067 start_codon:yes stop_codon:yes gene_type:complete
VKDFKELKAPQPKKEPVEFEHHGVKRIDNYYWMRDDSRKKPEVIEHLKSENKYLEKWFETDLDQRDQLFEEITSRIPKKEDSVPIPLGSYAYFRRYEPDNEHAIYIRKKLKSSEEEIILDVNKLAKISEFYVLANWSISPSEDLMAIAEDTTGRRQYQMRIKDISSGKFLEDTIKNTSGDMAWSLDGQYLFYVLRAPKTLLPFKVYRHKLGQKQSEDILVYEEKDSTFFVSTGNSRSMKYIEINISSTTSSETLLIDANNPESKASIVLEREEDHLYSIEDDADRLIVLTNWKAKNFRLMETNLKDSSSKANWKELVPHRENVLLQSFLSFPLNLVLMEREQGLRQIKIMDKKGRFIRKVKFNDPAYATYFASNPEYESKKMYFGYTSMRTPDSIYSYDLATGNKKLLKQLEVLGTFSPSVYKVERKNIKVRDGVKVPVSIVYKRDKFKRNKNPLFVYGYGSYGNSIDPAFNSNRLSLLDRGFVFAIAHVRGGQELGRKWYEDGKMFKKLNTFYDFIDVTKGLIEQGYANPERVYAAGGSAGGLLIGAVLNMEPGLYNGVISNVPFVDVITTMSDPSIPLTTGEYDEWGNPENKNEFKYIMQYSPYDNIDYLKYPSILVTAGLWDSQVQYYEPAKYVAKLREYNQSKNPILMKVNLSAGHSGVSGRFASLEEVAMEYAFLLRIDKNRR